MGCQSKEDKVKETVQNYLYKNMKNPESLKIISCEVRTDTVPFYLTEKILDLANNVKEALDDFTKYNEMSYLWADEKLSSIQKVTETTEKFTNAYKKAKNNKDVNVEVLAFVKYSATNPFGGTVSNSTILIIDKEDPTKILGTFLVDEDFIKKFAVIKNLGEGYEFEKNQYGTYNTDGLPYFEQFVLNDAN